MVIRGGIREYIKRALYPRHRLKAEKGIVSGAFSKHMVQSTDCTFFFVRRCLQIHAEPTSARAASAKKSSPTRDAKNLSSDVSS